MASFSTDSPDCHSAKRRRLEAGHDGGTYPCENWAHEPPTVVVDKMCDTLATQEEIICVGMLTCFTATTAPELDRRHMPAAGETLQLDADGKRLRSLTCETTYGNLDSRDSQILDLFRREGIEFDLVWKPQAGAGANKKKASVWVILYAPQDLVGDLALILEDLEVCLQDPENASRDVAYRNPQRYYNAPNARTSHFQTAATHFQGPSIVGDEDLVVSDVLDSILHTDSECTLHETPGSPHLLTELMSHQKQALTFMTRRESGWRLGVNDRDVWTRTKDEIYRTWYTNNIDSSRQLHEPPSFRGGAIADMMGLGKSLSIIALIAHDRVLGKESATVADSFGRGTLLVVPPALLGNWEDELKKHLSRQHFSWKRHHGNQRIHGADGISFHDIFLTSFTTLAKEWNTHPQNTVFAHRWHRVVLDEAHVIKNPSTAGSRAVCALKADCRWVVTATPLQNRLSELYSLFSFLRISPYCDKARFDETFTRPCIAGDRKGYDALAKLLGYTMLRRSNTAIHLPARRDYRRILDLTADEQRVYDVAEKRAIESVNRMLASNRPRQGFDNVLQKINALRSICALGCWARPGLRNSDPGTPMSLGTPGESIDDMDMSLGFDQGDFLDVPHFRGQSIASPRSPYPISPPVDLDQIPTKIHALIQDLQHCPAGTKSIVFSHGKVTLDMTRLALEQAGIGCVQVDGTQDARKRNENIALFRHDDSVQALLLTLGCGAVGLTLTTASRAYLMEPQWNPSIEDQAMARIHRLGQTKEVTTIRFVIRDSIEDHVLKIQNGKRDLVSLLSSKQNNGDRAIANLKKLRQLLR